MDYKLLKKAIEIVLNTIWNDIKAMWPFVVFTVCVLATITCFIVSLVARTVTPICLCLVFDVLIAFGTVVLIQYFQLKEYDE